MALTFQDNQAAQQSRYPNNKDTGADKRKKQKWQSQLNTKRLYK
jgi:hypothetical protein